MSSCFAGVSERNGFNIYTKSSKTGEYLKAFTMRTTLGDEVCVCVCVGGGGGIQPFCLVESTNESVLSSSLMKLAENIESLPRSPQSRLHV